MTKSERLEKLKKIIQENEIETQEMLLLYLKVHGVEVTQATVSRDINELGLYKMQRNNKQIYVLPHDDTEDGSLNSIINSAVLSICVAASIVVVKCRSGMAGAVCAVFDMQELPEIAGTLAGDDTIFLACKSEELANVLCNKIMGA